MQLQALRRETQIIFQILDAHRGRRLSLDSKNKQQTGERQWQQFNLK